MRLGAFVAFAAVLAVAGLHLAGVVEADATTLGLLAIGIALLLPIFAPVQVKAALRRVTKLSVGGVELGFTESERAERVDRRMPEEHDEVKIDPRPETKHPAGDVLKVRGMVKKRLRFIRDSLIEREDIRDYTDLSDHLRERDLLDEDETRLIYDLLGEYIAGWPDEARVKFLDRAWPFSYRLAALVWDRLTRQRLQKHGWYIRDFEQRKGHRPDFFAIPGDGGTFVIAARVASGKDPQVIKSRERLAAYQRDGAQPVVIVPEQHDYKPDDKFQQVKVLTLESFLAGEDQDDQAAGADGSD